MPSTLPEYLTNPDFILGDIDASWRYGKPPDYSKTRNYFNESMSKLEHVVRRYHQLHRPTYTHETNSDTVRSQNHEP